MLLLYKIKTKEKKHVNKLVKKKFKVQEEKKEKKKEKNQSYCPFGHLSDNPRQSVKNSCLNYGQTVLNWCFRH